MNRTARFIFPGRFVRWQVKPCITEGPVSPSTFPTSVYTVNRHVLIARHIRRGHDASNLCALASGAESPVADVSLFFNICNFELPGEFYPSCRLLTLPAFLLNSVLAFRQYGCSASVLGGLGSISPNIPKGFGLE